MASITLIFSSEVNSSVQVSDNSFIMFSKDNAVNMSSPLGYFGQAKFVNDSTIKGEIFATACDIEESSK